MEQKQRLLQLFNRTDPLPGTANSTSELRAIVLEIQAIMLGIVEPHGRRYFPTDEQRVIYAYSLRHCWAEWLPPGILDAPHHHFRFDITSMERHPSPWRKFVSTVIHESLHCAAKMVSGAPDRQINCAAMVSLNPNLAISEEFVELKTEIVDAFPFLADFVDVVD
uniref:Phage metallopeptidase domain-containing protein n=1 Tax=Globodera rostochiensis TaxID=31243 RepID=A0A914HCB9_GLORO